MDPESVAFQPRDDFWRYQDEMLRVQQAQAELADRVARLERKQDDDSRLKNVWGASSPFPSVLGGTPQQGASSVLELVHALIQFQSLCSSPQLSISLISTTISPATSLATFSLTPTMSRDGSGQHHEPTVFALTRRQIMVTGRRHRGRRWIFCHDQAVVLVDTP